MKTLTINGRTWKAKKIGNVIELISPKNHKHVIDALPVLTPDGKLRKDKLVKFIGKNYAI